MQNALIHGQPTLFRRILKWPYFPFIIFGIIMYIIHLSMQAGISDDAWAVSVYLADGFNVFDYLVYRFAHWSSRILLELLVIPSIGMPFMLWKLLNTLAYVSAGVFISACLLNCWDHENKASSQMAAIIAVMAGAGGFTVNLVTI